MLTEELLEVALADTTPEGRLMAADLVAEHGGDPLLVALLRLAAEVPYSAAHALYDIPGYTAWVVDLCLLRLYSQKTGRSAWQYTLGVGWRQLYRRAGKHGTRRGMPCQRVRAAVLFQLRKYLAESGVHVD